MWEHMKLHWRMSCDLRTVGNYHPWTSEWQNKSFSSELNFRNRQKYFLNTLLGLNFAGIKFRGFCEFWPNPRKSAKFKSLRKIQNEFIREIKSSGKIYKKTLIREILNFLKSDHQNFILILKILNVWSTKIPEILKCLGTVHPRKV